MGIQPLSIDIVPNPASGARSLTPFNCNANATPIGVATITPASKTALEVRLMPWRPMSCAMSAGTTYPAPTNNGMLLSHSHGPEGLSLSIAV